MKLRHIKRATQRRMRSPLRLFYIELAVFERQFLEFQMERLKRSRVVPENIKALIARMEPEQMSREEFIRVVSAFSHLSPFPGSSATLETAHNERPS